jgi:CCR4-NOT transcription complex subunit 1
MEEMRQVPTLKIDLVGILETAGLKASLDTSLKSKARANTEFITKLEQYEHNASVMQAVALYTANQAISVAGSKSHIFNKSGAHFALLQSIANDNPEAASNLINAMVNQLRFPNAHTFWFCQALLEIFAHANGAEEEKHAELREAIATVLLERLMPMRPHPWGLVVTFMELVKNQDTYDFQSLPFVREHDDIWARPQGLQPLSAPGLPPPGMSGF